MKRVKITVSGIVQGVGFRYYCYKKASEYGINGYVKNLYNGKVELEIEGDEGLINDYIKEVKTGPGYAVVKSVDIKDLEYEGRYNGFQIF